MTYPNSLQLHALFRAGKAEWVHTLLSRGCRARFVRVRDVSPSEVVLEFTTAYAVTVRLTDDTEKDLDVAATRKDPNRVFTHRLVLAGGIPAIK